MLHALRTVMRHGVVVALAGSMGLLAACEKGEQQSSEVAKPAGEPAGPARKPGLWGQTILVEGADIVQTVKLCLDKKADTLISWWSQGGARQACSKNEVERQPDGSWRFASVCESAPGVKSTTVGAVVGNFDERYQLKSEVTNVNSPIPQLNGTHSVTIDAEWLGPCPDGMRPGDMEMPSGQRINLLELGAPPS